MFVSVYLQNVRKDFFLSQSATGAQEWISSADYYRKTLRGTLNGTVNMLKGPQDAEIKSDS